MNLASIQQGIKKLQWFEYLKRVFLEILNALLCRVFANQVTYEMLHKWCEFHLTIKYLQLFKFEIQRCGQILCAHKPYFLMLGHICNSYIVWIAVVFEINCVNNAGRKLVHTYVATHIVCTIYFCTS